MAPTDPTGKPGPRLVQPGDNDVAIEKPEEFSLERFRASAILQSAVSQRC